MKQPHGNRSGGAGRPPSDRGPYSGPSGSQRRPSGQSPDAGKGGSATRSQVTNRAAQAPKQSQIQTLRAPAGVVAREDRPPPGARPFSRPRTEKPLSDHHTNDTKAVHAAPRRGVDSPKGTVWLYGHHAVAAALANPARRLRRLLLTEDAEAALAQQFRPPWPVTPERVDRSRMDQLLGRDIVHQGVALLADPLAPPSLQSVLEKEGPLVVLDQVTDPRNVGAIMRTAAAFGAVAVITQDRNAPEENGALAKAASGALETMPLLRAVNIARTLIALKAADIWCVGLDAAGGTVLSGPSFAGRRVALVLGAEGDGMRRLTKETCDEIAVLTIKGVVESLNVSAAAAVALYELTRKP